MLYRIAEIKILFTTISALQNTFHGNVQFQYIVKSRLSERHLNEYFRLTNTTRYFERIFPVEYLILRNLVLTNISIQ